ncbi:MAG: prepilin-type N-terminal cleavage/methylation domain-containing protein [Deltaproteobacteria bacterium]|nr:prepilin-type N-terminal cleavage/methylation domain-containing protein [Deltaproteobacteria bacterium]
MKKTRKAEDQKIPGGFTLLEILLAIFIFALIVSAIFTAYRGTFNIINDTESQEDIYQMARIALERITGDLEAAYFPETAETPETDSTNQIVFEGDKKEIRDLPCGELRFVSLAHLSSSDEKSLVEPAEIVYYGAAGSDGEGLDLYRSDTLLMREGTESGNRGQLICKGLSAIDFIYYDADGQPHESWDADEGATKGKLPSRVSIRMEFPNRNDPDRPYGFVTGVAIPMGG